MAFARSNTVVEGEWGVYHCMARCVRQAFLCGEDPYTGENYDHRKQWIQDWIYELTKGYAVEVLTYAVLSNHLHAVLRTRPDVVEAMEDEEVARRWLTMFVPRHVSEAGEVVHEVTEYDLRGLMNDADRMLEIRGRLSSLSWFMRSLNEPIARRANREDGVNGKFWGARSKASDWLMKPEYWPVCAM